MINIDKTKQENIDYIKCGVTNIETTDSNPCSNRFTIIANVKWIIKSDNDWVKIEKIDLTGYDAIINVELDKNNQLEDRIGYIYIKDIFSEISHTIKVTQKASKPFIQFEIKEKIISSNEEEVAINIIGNTNWKVSTKSKWISSIKPSSGTGNKKIKIKTNINESEDERIADINLTSDTCTPMIPLIEIKQEGIKKEIFTMTNKPIPITQKKVVKKRTVKKKTIKKKSVS